MAANPEYFEDLETRRSKSHPNLGVVKSQSEIRKATGETVMILKSNFLVDVREP